jgi:thioesterase domain-containing protein/acyl carrier protein
MGGKTHDAAAERTAAPTDVVVDDIAPQLLRIWQQVLGLESIAVDQNYFDLGGDSSLAVQMFSRIEEVFRIKLPLATLYDAPTVEELARVVRGEVATTGWSSLVAIQPNGTRPPFFCFHGAGGNVLNYRGLSKHLGDDQPFYGLQSQGLDGSCPPLTKVEDMAALYSKEMRKVQPHGPYLLGGYCGGGTVAFEVAQQLRADGEPVALLALFDTTNWSKIPLTMWSKAAYTSQRLVFHVAAFLSLDFEGKARFFREKMEALRSRIPVWQGMLLAKLNNHPDSSASASRVLGRIWQTNDLACWTYVPKPYSGKITDFRPVKQYRIFSKPGMKWDQLAQGGQEVIVLPVYPAGMLLEPFVEHLAVALRKSIDAAVRSSEGS